MYDIDKIEEVVFYEILKSREDRALMQQKIIDRYNHPIISFTLNIPGPRKDSLEYRKIHDVGMEVIFDKLKEAQYYIEYMDKIHIDTGPEGYFSLDIDPMELKRITVDIENNHQFGRLFDIDVFDSNHGQISRTELGFGTRKCLICEGEAKVCNRSEKHTLEELIDHINNIYNLYIFNY